MTKTPGCPECQADGCNRPVWDGPTALDLGTGIDTAVVELDVWLCEAHAAKARRVLDQLVGADLELLELEADGKRTAAPQEVAL